ncbi:MAG: hypothetical protein AAGA58_13130 [Verrucomicrobiota bacterium]
MNALSVTHSLKARRPWILLLTGIWAGLVLGISFVEAPLKFQAPGITLELGLGIGRIVFGALNKMELVLWVILAGLAIPLFRRNWPKRGGAVAFLLLTAILAFQTFFLLPTLDARAVRILDGEDVPSSWHHTVAIILEVLKLPVLLGLFFTVFREE